MKIYLWFGIILFHVGSEAFELKLNQFNESIITAPNAGLVLLHKGQYKPADRVIYSTALFPMTASTCHLLPVAAARKVPECNNTTVNIRNKRLITDIVSIVMAASALGVASTSLALSKKLEAEVNRLETNMNTMANQLEIGNARIVQFEKNQIRLGLILQESEKILNQTVDRVNSQSSVLQSYGERLNEHQQALFNLQQRIVQNEQATTNRFLSLAIHDIANNKPTLAFLHPHEAHLVAQSIFEQNNITIGDMAEQLPIIEVIIKMIIGQQMDYVSAKVYSNQSTPEIGKLMFTTFYALPNEENSKFDVYKIITTPFKHGNKMVQLAQMPNYIGINLKDELSISWFNSDSPSCSFQRITTCQETPPEQQSPYGNKCLEQILTGKTLRNCRTEHTKVNLPYVQSLQNGQWLISTNKTALYCIRTHSQSDLMNGRRIWSENTQVIIPSTAIVTVTNGTTIHCPEFNLPGPIAPNNKPIINIVENLTTLVTDTGIIDMQKHLISNATWDKLPYVNGEIDDLLQEMLAQATHANEINNQLSWAQRHSGTLMIVSITSILMLSTIVGGLVWQGKRMLNRKITIALPSVAILPRIDGNHQI